MRWSATAAALLLAAAPIAAAGQQQVEKKTDAAGNAKPIALRGCVIAGDNNSVVMTQVRENVSGQSPLPAQAHGRKVLFWLNDDSKLKPHVGHMVEVNGTTTGDIEKSEIEVKPGRQAQGGTVIEFEGPGRDIRASNPAVAEAVGTTGKTPEKDDVQTFLFKVNVEDVRPIEGTCQ